MSKAERGGFFDDDDDDQPESYQTTSAVAGDDSLSSNYAASVSPQRGWPAARQHRDSSVGIGTGGGRVSSVTGAAAGSSTRGGGGYESTTRGDSPSLDDILGDGTASREKGRNVQKLLRAYQNEIGAPELLMFPRELVERVVKTLATRKEMVRRAKETPDQDDAFYVAASIVAVENMRAAHVLKMFTRERIWKLEQCAEYYLQQDDVVQRLYPNEIAHAEGYVRLVKAYHDSAAMDAMPEQVTRTAPPVPTPDFSKPVFFRARRDCAPVVLPDGEVFAFENGSQHMCRYSTVRALLANGDIELI
ncbi:hypothetical protein JCM8547_005425 [Rhodosporidiobolus lusitaniae]